MQNLVHDYYSPTLLETHSSHSVARPKARYSEPISPIHEVEHLRHLLFSASITAICSPYFCKESLTQSTLALPTQYTAILPSVPLRRDLHYYSISA